MAKAKLPAAKDWENRELKDWNTTTFKFYIGHLNDVHLKTKYFPFGKWEVEQRMIKEAIDEYGQEVVKAYIDEAFRTHTVSNPQYPGLSFGFIYKYKTNILQRLIKEDKQAAERSKREAEVQAERLRALEAGEDDLDWI